MSGKVYLVGAGPGDPGLITVRGLACIKDADVVIYDYLASPTLLKHVAEGAETIYVGKKGGDHTLSQDGINALIVEKASQGHTVTRLKGGDPFIFGRGGEEAEVLIEAGIPFEIVPGVTSAIAAPAYAGIPLTHRKHTATVAFVTGHEDPEKAESNIDWPALAKIGTLVFFMGVKNLPNIVRQLIHSGKPPETPVAVVRWGTTSRQQTVSGTLADIVERVRDAGLKAPAIVVAGGVVDLRNTMKWFENRPLMGKTVIVTRAREQASDLVERLSALGATCVESPTIRIVPEADIRPLDNAIERLAEYQWLVFTSVNGVKFFFQRLFESGKDVRALGHLKTAVIGPVTKKRLAEFGIVSDIVPESYRAESVVAAFAGKDISGSRILLPRAADARVVLPEELEKMGAVVDEVIVYKAEISPESRDTILSHLRAGDADMVTFTSSSTARNFISLVPADEIDSLMKEVAVASIGPVTTETAESLGLKADVTASTFTIDGLCEAIVSYYGGD